MKIIISKLKMDNLNDYLIAKLAMDSETVNMGTMSTQNLPKIPAVFSEEECANHFRRLTEEEVKNLRKRQACGLKEVNANLPLAPGETIENDTYTCLKESYDKYPQYTPVLKRVTNMSEQYLLFDDSLWNGNDLTDQNREIEIVKRRLVQTRVGGFSIGSIIGSFISGFVNKLGEKLFVELFPTMDSIDYTRIANIVQEENVKTVIMESKGKLVGIKNSLNNLYPTLDTVKKDDLLIKSICTMDEILGILSQEDCKLAGLPAYMDCLLLELALYQGRMGLGIAKEGSADSIKRMAKENVIYINNTYNRIEEVRVGKIKKDKGFAVKAGGMGPIGYYYMYWEDCITGEKESFECQGGKNDPSVGKRDESYNSHVQATKNKLKTDLCLKSILDFLNSLA